VPDPMMRNEPLICAMSLSLASSCSWRRSNMLDIIGITSARTSKCTPAPTEMIYEA
jgi:hypothetical protein